MIGKINYGTGSLTKISSFSDLPSVGSESIIYYVEDTNTFYTWDSQANDYIRLKTRQNMYLLDNGFILNEKSQETVRIETSRMSVVNPDTVESPDIGDIVFDAYGACGNIISKDGSAVNIRTQQANLTKKIVYENTSWEMWKQDEQINGHFYWDSETGSLTYEGISRDRTNPIIYESYSINGGAANFVTTGGTRNGTRMIVAWDGGAIGIGTIRHYYTKNKSDDSFSSNEEVATIADIHSIVEGDSGIYIGYAQTEHELNEGIIEGTPPGHTKTENDWAYVMHYAPDVKQYATTSSFSVGDILEYSSKLFKVERAFTKTNWSSDSSKCFEYTGTRCSFIYRTVGSSKEWVLGMEVEQDFPFPDEVRLTTDSHNKMTIKAGGVDTVSIANLAVTTPKIADESVSNEKILTGTIQKSKLDNSLQETITKAETCWYSENLIVSANQPAAPTTGYIIWVDTNSSSL